jgi:multiple sugar transport system substrate-binding protein
MTTNSVFIPSRRNFLLGSSAVGAMLALSPGLALGQGSGVRFGIFGSATKLEIRGKAIAKYAELNPQAGVVFEGVPSDAWPDKIAAMVAGGNAPDVITLGIEDMGQYATRGALEPLDGYAGGLLNIGNFDETVLDLGRYQGKLYGLPIAVSIQGYGYNETILERLGMGAPPTDWTREQFADYCAEIHKADPTIYGSHDSGGRLSDFQMTLVANGRQLYTPEGTLGTTVDEVAAWLEYWNKMRESGGAVPADMQAQFTGTEWPNAPLVRGTAVFASMASQDIASGYQALTEDSLNLTPPPIAANGTSGLYPSPTSSVTLYSKSQNKDEAVKLMDWFVSDPQSALILGLVSGPPAAKPALEAVLTLPELSVIDEKVLKYAQGALAIANKAPLAHRAGRAMNDLMRRTNENVGFGTVSVQQGATDFMTEGASLLQQG